jgi:hypothetical protein
MFSHTTDCPHISYLIETHDSWPLSFKNSSAYYLCNTTPAPHTTLKQMASQNTLIKN